MTIKQDSQEQQKTSEQVRELLDSGLSKLLTGDFHKSLEDFKAVEVLDKYNPELLYNMGICYLKMGLLKTAYEYFIRVLDLPFEFIENNSVRRILAFTCIQLEKHDEASRYIEEVLASIDNDPVSLSLKGYQFEKLGKEDEAVSIFEEILQREPENINAANSLAFLLAKSDSDINRARELAEKVVKQKPDNPAYLDTLGYVLMKQDDPRAEGLFKKALKKAPFEKDIQKHLEMCNNN